MSSMATMEDGGFLDTKQHLPTGEAAWITSGPV